MKDMPKAAMLILAALILSSALGSSAYAVTSKISRHSMAEDFLKGETDNTSIDSDGRISLARQAAQIDLGEMLDSSWSINSVVAMPNGTVYMGTSPNAELIKYKNGKASFVYAPPIENASELDGDEMPMANRHIFAMAPDITGRLLVAISGDSCELLRFDGNKRKVLFQSNYDKYIFAITVDERGNIYMGTGPHGRVYRFDPLGKKLSIIAELPDNNVLSLATDPEGFVYAGTDERGLVYKINPSSNQISVLYDTDQSEVTALMFDRDGYLYAAATSTQSITPPDEFANILIEPTHGRAQSTSKKKEDESTAEPSTTLQIANTKEGSPQKKTETTSLAQRGELPSSAAHIYRITPEGFVTKVFSEMAVLFSLVSQNDQLLIGTGNNAQLFSLDPETEKKAIDYEDDKASQITAMATLKDTVFLGTANPAKLIKLSTSYEKQGKFTSDLIDARQPARWGKLQLDADIPKGCEVMLSTRSGNIDDPNDPSFSPWTIPVPITDATQVNCPNARFCQYQLILKNSNSDKTPIIREVAVAHVVPNLAPKVTSVKTVSAEDSKTKIVIIYKAKDDNNDRLVYDIHFRKLGRSKWIELEDDFKDTRFEWNTNTVADGRYEVMVTADDKRSNTNTTKLTGSRISDPLVIDNTPPAIISEGISITGNKVVISLAIKDSLTVIGNLSYTIDSNDDWIATLPDDLVYDTTSESFTIVIEDLKQGEHVIAVRIADDVKNTLYRTYDIDIK